MSDQTPMRHLWFSERQKEIRRQQMTPPLFMVRHFRGNLEFTQQGASKDEEPKWPDTIYLGAFPASKFVLAHKAK